jgi:ABC-type sugar transport system ATPase subunit
VAGVTFDGVWKRFGKVDAVRDVTLEIEDEEFLVLLGPSGCGKSTLLRMISGLDEPTEGTIAIGGRPMSGVEPKDRDVAMVFQSYALYPHKSVRDNIEYPLKSRRVPREERDRLVAEAAALLELTDYLARKPGQLSGGQRQRVALARAIVRQPAVFLMDEPLSNLDAKLRTQTRAQLIDLHERLRTTFVYVTHDQVEAMTMGDRVAILDRGVLQQVGVPQAVYDRPANLFVAGFIGSPPMNILPPGVVESGDHLVGVRPEHVRFHPDGGLTVKVRLVEALGHELHVNCEVVHAPGPTEIIVRVAAGEPVPEEGSEAKVAVDEHHRHRFDVTSGNRVEDPA